MNNDAIDEMIRDRLRAAVSHDLPDLAAPRTPSPARTTRRRPVIAATLAVGALVVISAVVLLVRNDSRDHVVRPLGASTTATGSTATSRPTTQTGPHGLADFPLQPRWSAALVAVPDGFIIWGGGREAQNMGLAPLVPDRAEYADGARYRASTDTWTTIPPAPVTLELRLVGGKQSFGAWAADTLYVARGTQAARWNPATREWHRLPDLAAPVEGLVAVDGQVIAIGPDVALTSPDSTTWTALPARPPIGDHIGLHVIVGGDDVYVVPSTKVDAARSPIIVYSTSTRTWRELPTPPIDSAGLDAGWDGAHLIIVNATTEGAPGARPRSAAQTARFDPATGRWTRLGNLPEPMSSPQSRYLAGTGGRFVATSSSGSAVLVGTTWKFQSVPAHALASVESEGVIYTLTLPPIGDTPTPTHNVVVAN